MVSSNSRETLHFRDFTLDVAGYQLRRNGRPVRLERQPMDVLILLVERRLQLVSRSEIVDRLWGKDVFVDVETGVHTAIRKIRQALHDSPETPVFVETVSGKGYRFIAPVEVVPASPDPPAAQAPESAVAVPSSSVPIDTAAEMVPPPPPALPHRTWTGSALTFTQSWRGRLIAGVLAVALGGLATWGWQRTAHRRGGARAGIQGHLLPDEVGRGRDPQGDRLLRPRHRTRRERARRLRRPGVGVDFSLRLARVAARRHAARPGGGGGGVAARRGPGRRPRHVGRDQVAVRLGLRRRRPGVRAGD